MNGASEADQHQLGLITKLPGAPGSGAARYGAAMYFYHQGYLSDEMLEIYRICCKLDDEDPIDLARFHGVTPPAFLTGQGH